MKPLRCLFIGHETKVTGEEVLGEGDFIEVTSECDRCTWSETKVLEYAGD